MLAATLPAHPAFSQNLQYQFTGMLVVFFALGSLALLVWLVGKIFAAMEHPETPTADQAQVPPEGEVIPGPVLAAISAAASVALEGRCLIIYDVRAADPHGETVWSTEGRHDIHSSHHLR